MTTCFISDTHFGHANIIRHCERPFADVVSMDSHMRQAWQRGVRRSDDVWFLGDFAFLPRDYLPVLFSELPGRKHLVRGNHDNKWVLDLPWASRHSLVEMRADGFKLVLCHYPLESWRRGAWLHFHGHAHGRARRVPGRYDVGVDVIGYRPKTAEEIVNE